MLYSTVAEWYLVCDVHRWSGQVWRTTTTTTTTTTSTTVGWSQAWTVPPPVYLPEVAPSHRPHQTSWQGWISSLASLSPPSCQPCPTSHLTERSVRCEICERCWKYQFSGWFPEQSVRLRTRAVECPALSSGQSHRAPHYHSISPSKVGRGACQTGQSSWGKLWIFSHPSPSLNCADCHTHYKCLLPGWLVFYFNQRARDFVCERWNVNMNGDRLRNWSLTSKQHRQPTKNKFHLTITMTNH